MEIDLRYYGSHNFLGRPVDGYDAVRVYITKEAATAMMAIQKELNSKGLGIKVFDAYRPQKAVNNFKEWALDIADTLAKQEFYPNVDKRDLFKLGYIAEKSGHSRGSTIDLTLIKLDDKTELDMGTGFDFFGEPSHHDYKNLTEEQMNNRKVLRNIMEKHGFKAIEEEWWHYTLKNEPFKDQYFDFDVK
jgi:D-alanyl-D-alanine dipeptidase